MSEIPAIVKKMRGLLSLQDSSYAESVTAIHTKNGLPHNVELIIIIFL